MMTCLPKTSLRARYHATTNAIASPAGTRRLSRNEAPIAPSVCGLSSARCQGAVETCRSLNGLPSLKLPMTITVGGRMQMKAVATRQVQPSARSTRSAASPSCIAAQFRPHQNRAVEHMATRARPRRRGTKVSVLLGVGLSDDEMRPPAPERRGQFAREGAGVDGAVALLVAPAGGERKRSEVKSERGCGRLESVAGAPHPVVEDDDDEVRGLH